MAESLSRFVNHETDLKEHRMQREVTTGIPILSGFRTHTHTHACLGRGKKFVLFSPSNHSFRKYRCITSEEPQGEEQGPLSQDMGISHTRA